MGEPLIFNADQSVEFLSELGRIEPGTPGPRPRMLSTKSAI